MQGLVLAARYFISSSVSWAEKRGGRWNNRALPSIIKVEKVIPTTASEFADEGGSEYIVEQLFMETIDPVVRDFVCFCVQRRGKEWLALYDEMCRVAGRHLFRGLGYAELKKLGLSFGLTEIEGTIRIVKAVLGQEYESQPS